MHAQWAACGIHMKNEQGEMVNLGLSLMPIGELTIEDTWFMAGMKGTGSNTIVAKDVFVPEHRFLPYPPAFGGTYRTEHTDEVVYRAAFVPITVLILAPSQLGVAQSALEHAIGRSKTRGITHTNFATQAESAGFQMQIAEAAMKIDTAFLHARRAADDLDRYAQESRLMDLTARARVRMDTALAAKYCREAVETPRRRARHVEPRRQQPHAAALARCPHRRATTPSPSGRSTSRSTARRCSASSRTSRI